MINIAKDTNEFCCFFGEYIKRKDVNVNMALDVLRISSIYLNRYSFQIEEEYNNTFKLCVNGLMNVFPEYIDLISEFERQCKIMHDVNNAFFKSA
ncbi:TPA: hypothetical protein ACIT8C_004567, partial [Salmonella enterica subsp. enterica serovar Virchow]